MSRTRALLAAALQFTCLVGGLGYLVTRQWKRFAGAFLGVLALQALNFVAAENDWKGLSKLIAVAVIAIQGLSALDVWRRADPPAA